METLLFKDSEMFIKDRPNKLTKKQESDIYKKLAKEIVDNCWSDDDIETIIEDLEKLSMSDSGYEMAKQLEGFSSNASYDIDTSFIEWLDSFSCEFEDVKRKNVQQWVLAHNIKPKLEKGTKLVVVNDFTRSSELKQGSIVYINGFHEKEAKYLVWPELESKRNLVVEYERIEQNCNVI